MGIDNSSKLIVGCHFDDLPKEIREVNDFYTDFLELNEEVLTYASEWYDSGPEGMIVGIEVSKVTEFEGLDELFKDIKDAFREVEGILKVKPKLICTQDIW